LIAHETGRREFAVESIRRAAALKPLSAMYHQNLGLALSAQGRLEDAVAAFHQALRLQPGYAQALDNLGCSLARLGRFVDAAGAHRQAIASRPDFAWAHCHLGASLTFLGQFEEARQCFARALELAPDSSRIYSDFLVYLQYQPSATAHSIFEAHLEYDRRHAAGLRGRWTAHANPPDPDRPLRLGFVSPHFHRHPVGHFLTLPLENLSAQEFTLIFYSDTSEADAWTSRLRSIAAEWHDTLALSDEELANRIRADGIDILFDLAGHTSGGRPGVFARKPAPIQITWLDYVGTTGLAAMDYILADPQQIRPDAERFYRERVLRADNYICYAPPANAPLVGPLPASQRGYVTFGSFNILAKTSLPILETWARILGRVPESRLLLKNLGLNDPETCSHLQRVFADRGIGTERLEMAGWSSPDETLAKYNSIDIALDTFPYNGGLTTCEALWMGVPVVTCSGETFASRHGLAHLTAAGFTETIASDLDDYMNIAVSLADNLPRLASLRATLRERVAASPLCDGPRFAQNFARLMRKVWQHWLQKATHQ
jgi:predicted O-linked N-acetylglucosamine transferase (SPINDLY family)